MFRTLILAVLALVGALLIAQPRSPASSEAPPLTWVATAHQFGPVGYRDPAGAISPDGRLIAYSEGRFLRVRSINGGPTVRFPPGDAQIRYLTWRSDSRAVIADGDPVNGGWGLYDVAARTHGPLFAGQPPSIRQPVWSPDGKTIAAIVSANERNELWFFAADTKTSLVDPTRGALVRALPGSAAFPAWTPRGDVACILTSDGRQRLSIPCGSAAARIDPDLDVYGPMALAPDGSIAYVAMPNDGGTVDMWAVPTSGGRAHRLTSFTKDSYGASLASTANLLFKVQSYRTTVAEAPSDGGDTTPLATFPSETPSWHPTGRWLGITYGTWRRLVDDAKYPDIAQEAGIIGVDSQKPATEPARVVDASVSEDQSLCWSPNGRWTAYHSHKEQSDDIWLRPAEGNQPSRRLSFLGRGAETGWPRWSPDGKWILFDGANRTTHHSVMYVIGIDQQTGRITSGAREIALDGITVDVSHSEWLPNSSSIVAVGKEGPGRHVIFTTDRIHGAVRVVHRFATEHDAPGLGVSPDGADVAFVAPASDGFFQIFRMPIAGGSPVQVTSDPSNKTQPAWSPDGRTIAFTVFDYEAQFWTLQPQ
jgi:Tol biopolymer transport system component